MATIASPANLNPLPLDPQVLARLAAGIGNVPAAPAAPAIAAPGPAPVARNIPGIQSSAASAGPLRAPGIASPRPMGRPAVLSPAGVSAQPLPPVAAPAVGQSPTQEALQASKAAEGAIKPPNYIGKLGVLEKIGDAAGRLLAPGIEQRLGVGTLGYQDRLAQAEGQTDRLEKQAATEAGTAATAAKPEEAQAKIDQANEKLDAAQQADQAKLNVAYRKLGLDAQGNPLPDEQLTPDELQKRKLAQATTDYRIAQQGVQTAQAAYDQARTAALSDPNNPAFKLAETKAQAALHNAQTNQYRQGYLTARLTMEGIDKDPALLSVYRAALGPDGNTLTDDQIARLTAQLPRDANGNPAGMNSQFAPTTTTRTRGQQAADVMDNFDQAEQQITELAPELGPLAGRWNDFLTGKVGADNPKFAALRANLDLLKGAYSRFHLNTEMGYKTFGDLLNAAQSPENLLASLRVMRELAERYIRSGQGFPHGGQPKAAPQPGHAASGYKAGDARTYNGATYVFKGGDPTVQANWEKH